MHPIKFYYMATPTDREYLETHGWEEGKVFRNSEGNILFIPLKNFIEKEKIQEIQKDSIWGGPSSWDDFEAYSVNGQNNDTYF